MSKILPGLTRHNLGRELLAGVTLIAIAIPLNIGYAQIAGLPPTAGLYALVVPTIVWVLVTSSRQLVVSPDAAAAALVASSLADSAEQRRTARAARWRLSEEVRSATARAWACLPLPSRVHHQATTL